MDCELQLKKFHNIGPETIIFPKEINFTTGAKTCQQLNGTMPLPKNLTELQIIFKNSKVNLESMQLWLPIIRSKNKTSVWVNSVDLNKQVTFLPWAIGQPNGVLIDQNCIIVSQETNNYNDIGCEELHLFACSLEKNKVWLI